MDELLLLLLLLWSSGGVEAPGYKLNLLIRGLAPVSQLFSRLGGTTSQRLQINWQTVSGLQIEGQDDSRESVRLVGGDSPCAGTLEVKQGEWRPVASDYFRLDSYNIWTLKEAAVACRELGCGSAVSIGQTESLDRQVWKIRPDCIHSGSSLGDCAKPDSAFFIMNLTCSDSVQLLNGPSLCSGRLEVKSNQSNQWWSSVCEADFDLQDAQVVCQELGCGPPSVLQGALYGEVEAPMWTEEFQCEGHESALLDCRRSGSVRNTCSPGEAVGLTCSEPVRLVGGASRCAGTLEVKQGDWRPVGDEYSTWTLREAANVCSSLDCGSAVFIGWRKVSSQRPVWEIRFDCVLFGSALRECVKLNSASPTLNLTCSDSVRLLNGPSLCSGRLEVKSNQSNQWWSSVCEADFDLQDAQVVCQELGCGPPSVLQGALYGEVEAPMWTEEFQCEGHESALLDCRRSGSVRNTCSPVEAVGLTCSEPVRLVGGASRCAGTPEVKHLGEWRPVKEHYSARSLKTAAVVCRELDCGSPVSAELRVESSVYFPVWEVKLNCIHSGSALRDCVSPADYFHVLSVTCLDSVRLLNGSSLCSGRLEVKSNQSNQWWSSVCEADFDLQDAEVVCQELGCGPPSVLQGALYGEVEAPMWTEEFQCEGHESALQDCRRSGSVRNTCSPGKAVGLTCSEPVRIVGGTSRCAGILELKLQGKWKPVVGEDWTLKDANVACKELDCGSVVSVRRTKSVFSTVPVWLIISDCVQSRSSLRDCARAENIVHTTHLTCSDSVRLLNGPSLCSGRLEVKSNQSNQWWSSVCEADFDLQDAQVVCQELGCGPPSVLQGALYGEVEAPMWTEEFQCEGHESALLDCRRSGSVRNTCSPGEAVGLTCSEPVRLVRGPSRCAGTLEVKQGDWRRVNDYHSDWTLKDATAVCRELNCGSAVSVLRPVDSKYRDVWLMTSDCAHSGSAMRECVRWGQSPYILYPVCSELLFLPNISVSSPVDGVSESQQEIKVFRDSNFTISCSIQPQYPGGSFQLTFTSSNTAHNYTQPAVSHSAHFLFPAAEPAHQGSYICVYHVYVFSHNFSSESRPLSLTVLDPSVVIIRWVVLPLTLLLLNTALYFYWKIRRGQKLDTQETTELDCGELGVSEAEGGLNEEEGAEGAE